MKCRHFPGISDDEIEEVKGEVFAPDKDMSSRKMRKDVSNEKWKIKTLSSGEGIT